MTSTLLDPRFARELEALRHLLALRARSGGAGDRPGSKRGGTAEFEEHRAYDGDDLRRVDWLAFARTGQPKVKVFREDDDVVVRLALDASASMAFGDPPKLDASKRIAAAIAYLSLAASERTEVLALGSGGDDARPRRREALGRAALGTTLRQLDAIQPGSALDLAAALGRLTMGRGRPGTLVVLSDFLDPGDLQRATERAAAAGHDVVLIEVLAPEELEPSLEGDCTLVDPETGEEVPITANGPTLAAYEARLAAHRRELAGLTRRARGRFISARSDEPLMDVIRRVASER
jgi:uncharacterized protein (DUF58 family)